MSGAPRVADDEPVEEIAVAPRPEVPVTSGRLSDIAAGDDRVPVRLRIPDLGVDAPIAPVGYQAGEMEVPPSADVVGWYRYGPAPGDEGSAVLAAHVDWGGRAGVFFDLRNLPAGAEFEVEFADGRISRFRSVRLTSYDKDELPVDSIFARSGDPVVTLITCGGAFNPSLRSYEDNVVVYAVPIAEDDSLLR
jgi:sortase (surface protein transpeptidase)